MAAKSRRTRYAVLALFALYVLIILFALVVPNNYRRHNVLVGELTWARWSAYVANSINLVPLRGVANQMGEIMAGQHIARNLVYLFGNVLGFSPLGFFLPALFARQRRFPVFFITFLASIAVLELIQVISMRGSFDIDDIILNTAGACLGFCVTRKFLSHTTARACKRA